MDGGGKGVRNRFGKNSFSVPDTFSCPYTQPEEDEQILVAPWGVLEFDARLTGKLTDVMTSVGSGTVDGKLTRRVERSLPLPGSSSGTQGDTHGGFSEHTDRWQLRPSW
ncbi:MAG: hypothetical protein ACK5SA_03545, partial [Planctomycetota bacterium]